MNTNAITFNVEEIDFELTQPNQLNVWINQTIEQHHGVLDFINFIFCDDVYLHKINMEYLNHDTYTDIITFHYSDIKIESDIFISIERVKENAKELDIPFLEELHRVMIHGVLHLLGYGDKSPEEIEIMRRLENESIAKLNEMEGSDCLK